MPRLSVWFIRAAMVYLALGFTFGGLLLFHKGISIHHLLWGLLPGHIEFLLVGWIVQLVMGVAFWILPRFSHGPKRGNESLAWLSFVLINLGVWLAGFGPLAAGSEWLVLTGRATEAGSALAFVLHAWPRIKPLGA